jgi:hypothetical protein
LSNQATTWVGGEQTTSTGETVTVFVASDADPDPAAAAARWAEFLAGVLHGPELGLVEAYFGKLHSVEEMCESQRVLGCYGGNLFVSIAEPVDGVTPEEVARHEYGHHVAAHRENPPWLAIDWGTKRWASEEDVCARSEAGTAFPGAGGHRYELDPGEAFAEAFRVADERRAGRPDFAWDLVDASFRPDERALSAVEEDVLRPWNAAPPARLRGRFAGRSRVWARALETRLDGDLEVRLRLLAGAGHAVALLDGGEVVARGAWTGSGVRTLRYRVCGSRALTLRVTRAGGPAAFTLTVAQP